jgi:hypothetical protein
MQRITYIALTLATACMLLISQVLAQTSAPPPPKSSLTPQQHEQVRAMNPKFKACHNKAVAAKIAPKERRSFMKSCLAG